MSSVMLLTNSAYSLLSPVSSQRCTGCTARRAAVDMKYNGGGPGFFGWQPAWKAALDAGDVMPAGSAVAATATTEGLSVSQWLGGAANVLLDATLSETVEERVAALLESGCPQSVLDSCLKNFDLVPASAAAAAPEPVVEAVAAEPVVAAPEPVVAEAPEPVAKAVEAPAMAGVVKPTKAKPVKPSPQGIFAPAVLVAADVMGRKELNALRAKVIAEHTKVISSFVETSESRFGQITLRRLFDAADADGNGTLDKEEVRSALKALGFEWLQEKQVDQIVKRGDANGDEVIDFEEFAKEAPKTLRVNLVKLAKQNGHDLGFLA